MEHGMAYRALGSTGIRVSAISFGAGPVPALMTAADRDVQLAVVERAVQAGVNWFDTAATYGQGQSETSLGAALRALGVAGDVHVATKVRLALESKEDIGTQVRASFAESLARLGLERVTLLQLHNAITAGRGDEPTSVTPADVLGPGGAVEPFETLRSEGRVAHLGITALGQADALRQVVTSGAFETIQVPYNPLNSSAGRDVPVDFDEADYGNVITECGRRGMGAFAIRVFAGGALAGRPPSAHTYKTKFFPLDLYERDVQRAAGLQARLGPDLGVREATVRFALSHADVSSAIIGFSDPSHVDEALAAMHAGPLPANVLETIRQALGKPKGTGS